VELFRINAGAHPTSWNAHDSLGQVLRELGEPEAARAAYAESVRLEPRNAGGRRALEELGGE
jgi:cytochrome c-type biogenesis protein CcmH/NrfG